MFKHQKKTRQQRSKARTSARGYIDKLADVIEETFDSVDNPRKEFALMFNDPDMLYKVTKVICPVVMAGVSSQILTFGKPFHQSVSDDRVDAAYVSVQSHLKKSGKWGATVRRFPDIKHIVRKVLERDPFADFDLTIEFDSLRDYDFLEDWLEYLEFNGKIPNDYAGWAMNHALEELEEKAEYLGMDVISKFEHNRLLKLDARYGKLDSELHKRRRPKRRKRKSR
jgi:hypothetical protein